MACMILVPQQGLNCGVLTTELPGKSQGKPVSESPTLHARIWSVVSCMVSFGLTAKPPAGLPCSHHTAAPCSVSKVVLHMPIPQDIHFSHFGPQYKCHFPTLICCLNYLLGFPGDGRGKEFACHCRRHKRRGFNPRAGRVPTVGNGSPLQYSCRENPEGKGAWWSTVRGVPKVLDTTEHAGTPIAYHTIATRTTRSHGTLLFHTRERILIIIPYSFVCLFLSVIFTKSQAF